VADAGTFRIGNANDRVKADKTAEIVFTSSGDATDPFDLSWDPMQTSRGLISHGTVEMFGAVKEPFFTMTADAASGATTLTLDAAPVSADGWEAGDELVLTGTYFQQNADLHDERLTLVSISGDEITIDSDPGTPGNQGLDHARVRADPSFRLHVANLTRNVVLTSDDTSATYHRGHVMFHNSDVDIRHVAFVDLGRTDKKKPLDDLIVTTNDGQPADCPTDYTGEVSVPAVGDVENRRGRYAVHFHLNGIVPSATTPPSQVHFSVVDHTPGWGFVNHSSHVDFRRNIAYDFDGAGFVTEAGDELGNFIENIAIRGNGVEREEGVADTCPPADKVDQGERYPQTRMVFKSVRRPQALSDFGFNGDGFWFQGPAIRAVDNVANGCHGTAMFWFTTGAPDITDIGTDNRNNYVGFPDSAMSDVYGHFPDFASFEGEHWDHATDELVIANLPILECDGLEAYGNYRGMRLRFNNGASSAWYLDGGNFGYDGDIVPIPGGAVNDAVRMRETISNLVLWNNEQSLRSRYSSKTDFEDLTLVNRLRYSNNGKNPGMELNFEIDDTTFTDIQIDGYTIAGWTDNGGDDVPSELTFSGTKAYTNYAKAETCRACIPKDVCPDVTSVTATADGSNAVDLTWDRDSDHENYLVRYWIDGEDYVEFATSTAGLGSTHALTLTGLDAATTYRVQVLAGCDISLEKSHPSKFWMPATAVSVTTDP
ncbi:MAG: fibronectin type III domain-containing protein, partial [Acidobacteriota bacterium]